MGEQGRTGAGVDSGAADAFDGVGRTLRVGLVGARGHVGAELLRLVDAHPQFGFGFVSSRELAGQPVATQVPIGDSSLLYGNLDATAVAASGVDAVVLALPNGAAAPFVAAIEGLAPTMVVVDLSADYRFDPTWHYGLPELTRAQAAGHPERGSQHRACVRLQATGQRRISNPGCYATAMQLALAPMRVLLDGPAQCFGVSGHSGAGTTPSQRNDPALLRDNLMPYALADHLHEREVSHRLGHPVEFMPHVAPHFRGLTVTVNMHLRHAQTLDEVRARYLHCYADEPLVRVLDAPPWVSRIAGQHHVEAGGFTLSADGRRLVAVATLDNLLKGAATQALQNLNLAFGLPELTGIPHPPPPPL